nr:type III pantothenate kinase [Parahaliea mediterranea]
MPRRCLQLDVGNSSAKWRLLVDGEISARGVYRPGDSASRQALLACTPELEAMWVSSVAGEAAEADLAAMLEGRWGCAAWFARSEVETLGLRNSYDEPRRMGVDRWLAMLAARNRHPDTRLCVVDAGSALTIDLVGADSCHQGGYIIPGPGLMERALLLDTDRVRFAEAAEYSLAPGTCTAQAVRHGIGLAQAGAVTLALREAALSGPPLPVFTGGGGEWLAATLGGIGEFVPDLVLDGLQLVGQARAR